MNFEQLEMQAKDPKTKLILVCSPQNPSGRLWTKEELTRMGNICIDNGVKVVVDEIHSDLILTDREFVSFATISDKFAQNSIICTSPSKSFNVAGLLVSDIIIPMMRCVQHSRKNAAILFMAGCIWRGSTDRSL